MKVFIIGCGRVGMGLIRMLTDTDIQLVGGSCNTEQGAEKARKGSAIPIQVSHTPNIPSDTDVIWITTPDDAIGSCAGRLWEKGMVQDSTTLIHASGALPSKILRENAPGVASVARAHPLQSFAPVAFAGNQGKQAHWFIEGESAGSQIAHDLLQTGGAHTHSLPTDGGLHYHTAASLASNGLVALTSVATKLAQSAGISKNESLQILLPLMRGTLDNLDKIGLPEALTGPIARGDGAVVQAHIDTLDASAPDIATVYRALGRELISIAEEQGYLDSQEIQALVNIIEKPN